jgi:hypothetical protein
MRRLLERLPQRYRLRLWLLRDYFRWSSFLRRRAQPSRARRVVARGVLARRGRELARREGPVGVDRLARVTVINLDARPDRLATFRGEMGRLGIEGVERFEAIRHENGLLGCGLSHAECLRQMIAGSWDSMMVCEDDARFLVNRRALDVMLDDFLDDPKAEVACLAYYVWASRPHDSLFLRGLRIQTTACYVVKATIAEELLEVWEAGIEALAAGGSRKYYGCDKVWMPLQRQRVFLVPMVRAVRQESGYSDIVGAVVEYTH